MENSAVPGGGKLWVKPCICYGARVAVICPQQMTRLPLCAVNKGGLMAGNTSNPCPLKCKHIRGGGSSLAPLFLTLPHICRNRLPFLPKWITAPKAAFLLKYPRDLIRSDKQTSHPESQDPLSLCFLFSIVWLIWHLLCSSELFPTYHCAQHPSTRVPSHLTWSITEKPSKWFLHFESCRNVLLQSWFLPVSLLSPSFFIHLTFHILLLTPFHLCANMPKCLPSYKQTENTNAPPPAVALLSWLSNSL
jgi:hypothetical protein